MQQLVVSAALAVGLVAPVVQAEEITVAGHQVSIIDDGMGRAVLIVDDALVHMNGVIHLDDGAVEIDGAKVLIGVAGAGGNACAAAPVVLVLPEDAPVEFWGPVDSCSTFTPEMKGPRLVFAAEALPGMVGETWEWTRASGFARGADRDFEASLGWDSFEALSVAHPVEALGLAPVLRALQAGLGADYPLFAQRISGLGSGGMTSDGYLGTACMKATCDLDWALLYLHESERGIYAAWRVAGSYSPRLWPVDIDLWPEEAVEALRAMP